MFAYSPLERYTSIQALADPFFDSLRAAGDTGGLGLFQFNEKERQRIVAALGEEDARKIFNE